MATRRFGADNYVLVRCDCGARVYQHKMAIHTYRHCPITITQQFTPAPAKRVAKAKVKVVGPGRGRVAGMRDHGKICRMLDAILDDLLVSKPLVRTSRDKRRVSMSAGRL